MGIGDLLEKLMGFPGKMQRNQWSPAISLKRTPMSVGLRSEVCHTVCACKKSREMFDLRGCYVCLGVEIKQFKPPSSRHPLQK